MAKEKIGCARTVAGAWTARPAQAGWGTIERPYSGIQRRPHYSEGELPVISIDQVPSGIILVRVSGKLTACDMKEFVAEFQSIADTNEPLRLLIELDDFRGWELKALWEDLKFDVKHQDSMDRVAIVGDHAWQSWGVELTKPFFRANMRFFDGGEVVEAQSWLIS